MDLLVARADKRLLTLDWDTEAVRIVHVRIRRTDVRILKALSVPWTPDVDTAAPESMGVFIRRVLDQQRIRTVRAIVDIPRDQVVVHTLGLPSGNRDELPSMVQFQIVKELPFSLDEAVVEFVVAGGADRDAESGTTVPVLVAAVRNEVLAHYQRVVESAGLTAERIGLRPHANHTALSHGAVQIANGRTLYVDVGPTLTEIDVIRHGQLAFSRAASVSVPVVEPTDVADSVPAGGAVSALLVEVTRSIEAFRANDPGASVDRAVIGGSCGIESVLAEAMTERFGFRTSLYTPADQAGLSGVEASGLTGFSAALGLALGQVTDRLQYFDFLNPKRPEEVEAARRRKVPMTALVVLLFVSAAAVLYYQFAWPIQRDAKELRALVKERQVWEDDFDDFKKQLEIAEAWVDRDEIWLEELDRIVEALPPHEDAYLEKMTGGKGAIRIDLRVTQAAYKDMFIKKLETVTIDKEEESKPRYRIETGDFSSSSDPRYKFRGSVTVYLTEYEADAKSAPSRRSRRR